MIPIQAIQISTSGNALHTIHIIQLAHSTKFGVEVIVYDPQFNTSYSSLVPISGSLSTPSDAFRAAFTWVSGWLKAKSQTASKINNPCNCEFLSAKEQESIVRQDGIQLTVEVNA